MDLNAISDELLDVASTLAASYGGVSFPKESFHPPTREGMNGKDTKMS